MTTTRKRTGATVKMPKNAASSSTAKRGSGMASPSRGQLDQMLTRKQLERRADKVSKQMLGVRSRDEAFAKLDSGDLDGTIAEAELRMLRSLLRAS